VHERLVRKSAGAPLTAVKAKRLRLGKNIEIAQFFYARPSSSVWKDRYIYFLSPSSFMLAKGDGFGVKSTQNQEKIRKKNGCANF
jgi:hypothetical protein